MTLLEGMRISDKDLGGKKRENCQLTNLQLFQIILILPFMAVPGFSHYAGSSISKLFGGKKDILYSFMAKDNIDWRNIIWHIACHLIKAVTIRKDYQKSHLPAVLIVDDSDLPKTGLRMECIGKIFSHVFQRCILGYKLLACAGATAALNLSWTSRFTAREGRSMARNKVLRPGSARGATTASVTATARQKNARKSISYPSLSSPSLKRSGQSLMM